MDALLYFADDVNISGYNSVSLSSIYTSLIPVSCHKSALAGLGLCRIHLGKLWSKKDRGCRSAGVRPERALQLPPNYPEDAEVSNVVLLALIVL